MRRTLAATLFLLCLALPAPTFASGDPDVAALQVGLLKRGLYGGSVDGTLGAATESALRKFQRRRGLAVDGVPGPQTRAALGRYGRRAPFGTRPLAAGNTGWDVAALQFALAWHGFPSGTFDGHFGAGTEAALRRYQRWAGLPDDGRAGPSTIAALRSAPPRSPIPLSRPSLAPLGDVFGPRGARFHTGVDFPAPAGSSVTAPGAGRVAYAGPLVGGWGNVVTIAHGQGVRTMLAHLSRVDVHVGDRIAAGAQVGLVGSTGHASGPHLHFEVRLRGAAVDPLSSLS